VSRRPAPRWRPPHRAAVAPEAPCQSIDPEHARVPLSSMPRRIMSRCALRSYSTRPQNSRPTSSRSRGIAQLWANRLGCHDFARALGPQQQHPPGQGQAIQPLAIVAEARRRWQPLPEGPSSPPINPRARLKWGRTPASSLRRSTGVFSSRTQRDRLLNRICARRVRPGRATWRIRCSVRPLTGNGELLRGKSAGGRSATGLGDAFEAGPRISRAVGRGRSSNGDALLALPGTLPVGFSESPGSGAGRRRLIESLRRRGRLPSSIAVAMESRKQKNGRLILGKAFEAVEGRRAIADGLASDSASRRSHQTTSSETGCACPSRAAAGTSRVSTASPPGCGIQRNRSTGTGFSRSEWRPRIPSHGQPPSAIAQVSWPSRPQQRSSGGLEL